MKATNQGELKLLGFIWAVGIPAEAATKQRKAA
jgi:hypothetical protein